MVADFRQFYGMDLPLEPVDEDCSRWALLWYGLPRESRTARRQSPELRWSEGEYMLASAVHALEVLVWQRTKDGRRGGAATTRWPRAKASTGFWGYGKGARKWQSTSAARR